MPPTPSGQRLIRLLTMLPSPDRETFPYFWDKVAAERHVSRSYVTGKIAVHLHLILGRGQESAETGLASYALYFFADPSKELLTSIAGEIDHGSPTAAPGRAWLRELHSAAFAVLEAHHTTTAVDAATTAWIHHFRHP